MTAVDAPVDQRRWIRRDRVTYVRIPEADYRNGRTVAYAVETRPSAGSPPRWEVRLNDGRSRVCGGGPATSLHRTREHAEDRLAQATAWARRPRL